MKRIIVVALAVSSFCLSAAEITGSNAEIVVSPDAPGSVNYAARELSDFLGKSLGAKIGIVNAPTDGKASIVLGSNDWSRAAGIDTAALDRDEFSIKAVGDRVYIAGRDAPGEEDVVLGYKAKYERATLYGVYEFLHRYADIRMYFPGELGTIIPKKTSISLPDGELRVKPSYIIRRYGPKDGTVPPEVMETAGYTDEIDFKRFARFRGRLESIKLPCCHGQLYSRFYKRFAKTHPEYFIMGKDGKRHPTEAVGRPIYNKEHVCDTSGIWEEIYLDAKAYLTGQPPEVRKIPNADGTGYSRGSGAEGKYYDIMPHDGGTECYCKTCQSRYDHSKKHYATDLIWSNTVAVAKRLKAEGVKGYVTQMAYHPYGDVPDFDIPDNVLVMVAQQGPWARTDRADGKDPDELVKKWAEKTNGKVWLWTYPDKIYERRCPDIPQMSPHAWGNYYKRLSKWIFGAFAESESDRWIYNYLNYYIYSCVCWDVNCDIDAILDEHYSLMFGPAAGKMKEFFESLEQKWVGEMMTKTSMGPKGPISIMPGYYETWAKIYSPEVLARYAKILDDAAAAVAPGSIEARRIAMFRREMLDPLAAAAKDAHDAINVEKSLKRRAAEATGKVVFEDKGGDLSVWDAWPKGKAAPVRATEKGPVSAAPMMLTAHGKEIQKTWVKLPLKPGTKYRLSYFMRLDDLKVSERWGRFSCRLKFDGAPKVGRDAPRFIETTSWMYVVREYETPASLKPETCKIECTFSNAKGRAFLDGLRLEEVSAQGDVSVAPFIDRADGKALCTEAFAKAIEACSSAGGGRVVVPAGRYLTGPVRLRSGIELHLEKGAVVEFADDPALYLPAVPSSWEGLECLNYSPLLYAYGCTNVAVTGGGTIRAKMDFWRKLMDEKGTDINGARAILYKWGSEDYPVEKRDITKAHAAIMRPQLMQFNRCKGVRIEDVRIEDSPFWTIHLYQSEDVGIRRIDMCAHGFNNDGVDIEMTRNVLIEDSVFDQGDDGFVFKAGRNRDAWRIGRPTENVEVRNCRLKTVASLIGVGSELSGGIRNIYVHDCTVERACNLFYVKTNHRRGGFVENVRMENVKVDLVSQVMGVDTEVLYQWRRFPDYETRLTPIKGLYMKNVRCGKARTGVNINGDARMPVKDVRVEDVRIGCVQDFLSRVTNAEDVDIEGLSCDLRGKVETPWDDNFDPTAIR